MRALETVQEGLQSLGVAVKAGKMAADVLDCEFVFLSNTCMDQRANAKVLSDKGIPFALIGFHEDFVAYYGMSMGFAEYVSMCLKKLDEDGVKLAVDDLWECPERIAYYGQPPPRSILLNVPVMREARFCLVSSHREARTMKRDCPASRPEVVFWNAALCDESDDYSDEFLEIIGLSRGEYILQVGRLETRKNQLASVLATRNLDVPLVLVATKGYQNWYDLLVVNAAAGYRKAPTLLVSEEYPTQIVGGNTRIIQMPGGRPLSEQCIRSAYQNCGLHLHPAFWESPGYTYLEAAKIGVPTVASEWGTLQDYCEFGGHDKYMRDRFTYVCPYDLPGIERAVKRDFGRQVDKDYTHPIFKRTQEDVAREILQCLQKHGL